MVAPLLRLQPNYCNVEESEKLLKVLGLRDEKNEMEGSKEKERAEKVGKRKRKIERKKDRGIKRDNVC